MLKKLNTELGPDSISAYAFAKSCQKHRVAVSSGVNQVRHCPLMTHFGTTVFQALGDSGGLYDLVEKNAGFQCSCHLRQFTTTNSNDSDGIMYSNCRRVRDMHNQKFPNADRHAYSLHINLSFDGEGQFYQVHNVY